MRRRNKVVQSTVYFLIKTFLVFSKVFCITMATKLFNMHSKIFNPFTVLLSFITKDFNPTAYRYVHVISITIHWRSFHDTWSVSSALCSFFTHNRNGGDFNAISFYNSQSHTQLRLKMKLFLSTSDDLSRRTTETHKPPEIHIHVIINLQEQ